MASNKKEEIKIEFTTNYNQAIQQIEQVKKSVGDNADELEHLNQVQKKLESDFKHFEKTLDQVNQKIGDNETANKQLTDAIERLEKQIINVDKEVVQLNKNLDKLSDTKVDKTIDKSGKSIDKANDSTKDLTKSTGDLSSATKTSTGELVKNAGAFEVLDQYTMGFSSKIVEVLGLQNGFGQALRGNAEAFEKMSKSARASTIAINTTKLALKTLLTITGIGLLVVGLQTIAENWEEITKSIRSATDSAYAHNQAITDTQIRMREQLDLDDLKINRLKQQGKSEQELIKIQLDNARKRLTTYQIELKALEDMGVKSLTFGESVSLYFKNFGDEFKLNTLRFKQNFENMLNSMISGYESFYNQIKNSPLLTSLGLTDGKDAKFKRVDFGVGSEMVAVNDAITARTDSYLKNTQKYKDLAKEVATADSVLADYENRLNDLVSKNGSKTDKKSNDDVAKAKEQLKAWQEVIRNLTNDTSIINAGNNPIEKRLKEIAKLEDDYIIERQSKYDELKKIRNEGSEDYIREKKIIDDYYNSLNSKLTEEKTAIDKNAKAFEELSKKLNDGTMNAEEMKKEIDEFLKGVENSEMRDKWSKLLGLEQIENAISLVGELKDEIKDYEIDTTESFNKNKDNLAKTLADNILLIEKERDEKLKQLGDDEKFAKERKQIQADADNAITKQQEAHSKAGKELNKIRGEQIRDMASSTIDGLANLNSALGENFEIAKMTSAGSAIINTWEGVTNNLAQYPQPVAGIMAGVTIASGIASVISILKTSPESAGSNLPTPANLEGAKNMPNVQFMQSETSQLQNTIAQQNNQDNTVKAYVVGKDVTSQAEKDSIKKKNSSL